VIKVVDVTELSRYELHVDDELVGVEVYRLEDGAIALNHTEVFAGHEGRGHAAVLVRGVLDDARRRHLRVIANCPYVARFIEEHLAEYGDLLADPAE